jgi:hypothetical protein
MEFGVRTQKRMLRRALAATVTLLVAAASVACTTPAPKPTPTLTAIFASEDEALAAATDTYEKYTAALDSESANGDASAEAIRDFVTPEYFEQFAEPSTIKTNGWHTEGVTTFDSVSLLTFDETEGRARVSVRLCRDVSGLRILDAEGNEVLPPGRSERFPVEVRFLSESTDSATLSISESGSWSGDDFC